MIHFLLDDYLDFCFDAPNSGVQNKLAIATLTDQNTIDTVRYIMSLKLELCSRDKVRRYVEHERSASYFRTMLKIGLLDRVN